MERKEEPNKALTFEEKIKAGYLYFIRGVIQADIAVAFSVNIGRVNEAISALKEALADEQKATH